jgi:hypothetical protein
MLEMLHLGFEKLQLEAFQNVRRWAKSGDRDKAKRLHEGRGSVANQHWSLCD